MIRGVGWRRFFKDLEAEIQDDNVSNGAAALAFYMMLSVFPAAIFLLTLLPYLPIANLESTIMDIIREALPGDAATMFTGVVQEIATQKRGGLLSFGLLLTLWTASNGLYAVMQQLNVTYDVKESRPFWKARGIALLLTVFFTFMVVVAIALLVFGGMLQSWLADRLEWGVGLNLMFSLFRWVVIAGGLMLGFALVYYFGPDVEQDFRFISPGSVLGVVLLVVASLAFRFYVSNFGNYSATYGTLGAVVVLLLWLLMVGWVILLGSEVNALLEHYHPSGKVKGRKQQPRQEPGMGGELAPGTSGG